MGRVFAALEKSEKLPKVRPPVNEAMEVAHSFELFKEPPQLGLVEFPSEPFEKMKATLISLYRHEDIKTVLLVGTDHGGGCSTTAIGLASSLAKGLFQKVLLIDANLRTPDLHNRFRLEKSEQKFDLSNAGDSGSAGLKKAGYGNLFITTCACSTPTPVEILASSKFGDFLQNARTQFDFILIDGSPIPRFSDSLLLARQVDGVVVVVEAGKTSRQVALAAKQALENAGARILGVVLNKRNYFIPGWLYKRL
ncbi:MAG: CpsD/CapB family tyrosine-protein kinase [Deltaproteobacteria bacterium]|nr:CpsD/CapB family tyrosine-protein kinase [Deltaproteobacteria bacterium]